MSSPAQDHDVDRAHMRAALDQALAARAAGEVPVGAVVAAGEQVLARGHNRTILDADPTAHAEIVALREAARRVEAPRLPGTSLYVTLEPCIMCFGASVQARVERVVFAASDPKIGASSLFSSLPVGFHGLNHTLRIDRGPFSEEASSLLREFFRERR
jgi:tRNA(adenine34) deaminase